MKEFANLSVNTSVALILGTQSLNEAQRDAVERCQGMSLDHIRVTSSGLQPATSEAEALVRTGRRAQWVERFAQIGVREQTALRIQSVCANHQPMISMAFDLIEAVGGQSGLSDRVFQQAGFCVSRPIESAAIARMRRLGVL